MLTRSLVHTFLALVLGYQGAVFAWMWFVPNTGMKLKGGGAGAGSSFCVVGRTR